MRLIDADSIKILIEKQATFEHFVYCKDCKYMEEIGERQTCHVLNTKVGSYYFCSWGSDKDDTLD